MQKELPDLHPPGDFSLPLASGQVRVRGLVPAWVAELQAMAGDTRLNDSLIVREALKRASAEPQRQAERIAEGATEEDLERVAEKLVANNAWLVADGAGGEKLVRRFDNEAHSAHFRRALLWRRAHPPAAAIEETGSSDTPEAEAAEPGDVPPPRSGTWTLALWGLVASIALSTAAAVLAGLAYFEGRDRFVRSEREQRNAFDAVQQQLNANNEELRRLRSDLQAKPATAAPEPRKPQARPVQRDPRKQPVRDNRKK